MVAPSTAGSIWTLMAIPGVCPRRLKTRRRAMRSTLIALATAGLLASGGAVAGTTNVQVNHSAIVPVQYSSPVFRSLGRSLCECQRTRGAHQGADRAWIARWQDHQPGSAPSVSSACGHRSEGACLHGRRSAQLSRGHGVEAWSRPSWPRTSACNCATTIGAPSRDRFHPDCAGIPAGAVRRCSFLGG